MKDAAIASLSIIGTIIVIGLILRYGGTSVPLAQTAAGTIEGGLQALTLANPAVYPYEGPKGS
jgi:hypothetical protein